MLNGDALRNRGIADTPSNLNNATKAGGYYYSNANFDNLPVKRPGYLLVFGQSKDRFSQLFVSDLGDIYARGYFGSNFTSWTGK